MQDYSQCEVKKKKPRYNISNSKEDRLYKPGCSVSALKAAADRAVTDLPLPASVSVTADRKRVQTRTRMARRYGEQNYLAAPKAFKRPQRAVSEFNVKDGDIAAVAHSSTGQSVALLLLQRRHLTHRSHTLS